MRIGIDLRWISRDTGGIRQYVLNLVENLARIDEKNTYVLLFDRKNLMEEAARNYGLENKANFHGMVFKPGPFSLKSQMFLPGLLRRERIDLFHSPDFIAPVFTGKVKLIVTVHDLIPYLYPQLCSRSKKVRLSLIYRFLTGHSVRKSVKIITVSDNSRKDIIKTFNLTENKVNVIYDGVDGRFKPIDDSGRIAEIKKEYALSDKNILYVGRQDPSKNLVGLIRAFDKLKKEKGFKGSLVIVGKKDLRYPEPYDLIEKLKLQEKVIFTGYIDGQKLPLVYNACELFVFPSFYEGFGLPPLEAMACGVPVIVSDRASLPEVVGDAGIIVNPSDIDELAEAIDRVLNDVELRSRMVRKGLSRAQAFRWEDTARKTLAVYEELKNEIR